MAGAGGQKTIIVPSRFGGGADRSLSGALKLRHRLAYACSTDGAGTGKDARLKPQIESGGNPYCRIAIHDQQALKVVTDANSSVIPMPPCSCTAFSPMKLADFPTKCFNACDVRAAVGAPCTASNVAR
ncbi:MAG: hypothetical protein Ct9H300mP8_08750 [Gammaproteobacteria bacterium]|nr:MAG: hypothetical protein Ct9H300mP8_08750 [Gammaproteobacteria bacterium]